MQGEQAHVLLLVLQQVQLVHDEVEQQDLEDVEEQQAILIICCFELVSDNWLFKILLRFEDFDSVWRRWWYLIEEKKKQLKSSRNKLFI